MIKTESAGFVSKERAKLSLSKVFSLVVLALFFFFFLIFPLLCEVLGAPIRSACFTQGGIFFSSQFHIILAWAMKKAVVLFSECLFSTLFIYFTVFNLVKFIFLG